MPEFPFGVGDYIEFTRIVFAGRESRVVSTPGSARPIAEPSIPEQILNQRGDGCLVSIAKHPKKIKTSSYDKYGDKIIETTTVHTGRVDAGEGLGQVSAVLDDAVLAGKQGGLFDMAAIDTETFNQYGTEGRIS